MPPLCRNLSSYYTSFVSYTRADKDEGELFNVLACLA